MRSAIFALVFTLSVTACASTPYVLDDTRQGIEIGFSPGETSIELVVATINSAKSDLELAGYSFTSQPVTDALISAQQRGVKVRVVLDGGQSRAKPYKALVALQDANVPVRFNHHYAIMHNKFIVVDHRTVETGSFNYTHAAEAKNAENVIVVKNNPQVAKTYEQEWQRLWDEGTDN